MSPHIQAARTRPKRGQNRTIWGEIGLVLARNSTTNFEPETDRMRYLVSPPIDPKRTEGPSSGRTRAGAVPPTTDSDKMLLNVKPN